MSIKDNQPRIVLFDLLFRFFVPGPNTPLAQHAIVVRTYSTFPSSSASPLNVFPFKRMPVVAMGSFNIMVSPLSNFISIIVRVCSEKQVVRVNTRAIVALMQNTKSFWYGSSTNSPRHSVGHHILFSSPIEAKSAIAINLATANPLPTLFRGFNINFGPKSSDWVNFYTVHTRTIGHSTSNLKGAIYGR